jgi:hypothetical protein
MLSTNVKLLPRNDLGRIERPERAGFAVNLNARDDDSELRELVRHSGRVVTGNCSRWQSMGRESIAAESLDYVKSLPQLTPDPVLTDPVVT